MKKMVVSLTAFAAAFIVALCSCGSNGSTADIESQPTAVAVGYSLKQMSLKIDSNVVAQQEIGYQDAAINGTATELFAGQNGKQVSALYLQAFYQKDLGNSEILIGTQTYSKEELASSLVYEDQNIVVYDISNFIYQDTMSARIEAAGLNSSESFEETLNDCVSRVDTLIVKASNAKQPSNAAPEHADEHEIEL
ncbi:hypothetical protein [Massiliimalia massiliensis]|uniref:hypothetical protein n=1 Tax=Massiliimalia massiliensis TaxID=1852384 RepID=UPI000985D9A0|nr:hypothetical protein [Massiliimalia massiliensis]